jgi:hypothetical protein
MYMTSIVRDVSLGAAGLTASSQNRTCRTA